ncbi:MAG: hypothetical protein KDA24_03035 [Deltaproteobacteria bacterium]|nr:hypothetical protein [Deltaproteobacteria bacterium]
MRRVLALALALPLAACAPTRDGEDPSGNTPTNDFETALFTIVDYGSWSSYQQGNLVLVDQDITCDDLQYYGTLDAWSLPAEVDWVQAYVQHGNLIDGWLQTYESLSRAEQSGTSNSESAQHFWGEVGIGPVNDDFPGDPEDPSTEPPNPGRDILATIGRDEGVDDELDVSVSSEETLAGTLSTWQGDWSFSATKCDTVYDQPDGTEPDDPPDEDGDGSDSSDGSDGSTGTGP